MTVIQEKGNTKDNNHQWFLELRTLRFAFGIMVLFIKRYFSFLCVENPHNWNDILVYKSIDIGLDISKCISRRT